MAQLDYVELPVVSASKQVAFYGAAFGWNFTAYGDDYAAHEEGPCQLAFNGTDHHRTAAILPVIRVDDIEAACAAVQAAGGMITMPIFDFPGGRRFHFSDPEGMELGCYEPAEA